MGGARIFQLAPLRFSKKAHSIPISEAVRVSSPENLSFYKRTNTRRCYRGKTEWRVESKKVKSEEKFNRKKNKYLTFEEK